MIRTKNYYEKITHYEKIDDSKAKIVGTLYIQIDKRKWMNNIQGKYVITVSFRCSSIDLGTFENLMKRNFRYRYLVMIPIKVTGIMHGIPPLKANPTKKIMIIFA